MMRASLEKDPSQVASMFDEVAPRYDLTNAVLSGGLDRLWRRVITAEIAPTLGLRVLDLGAGTGASTEPLADAGAEAVPADFSLGMLREGRRRRPDMPFVAADATALPFADATFDVTTISFALRNVVDPSAALAEMARVTRPGGRLVVGEFSTPTWGPFRRGYEMYLQRVLPTVAGRVSSNPASYDYLVESIAAWPTQPELAIMIQNAGWSNIEWRNLSGGIVAVHRAVRR